VLYLWGVLLQQYKDLTYLFHLSLRFTFFLSFPALRLFHLFHLFHPFSPFSHLFPPGARPFDVFMKGVPPRILLGFATALVYMYAPTSFADDACTQWTMEEQCVAPISHPNPVEDTYACTWSRGNGTCYSSHGPPEPSLFGLVPPRVWHHRIWYLSVVVIALVLTFLSNAMFVAQMSLFAKISDPRIGGTYV
jgi:hypothetical protein